MRIWLVHPHGFGATASMPQFEFESNSAGSVLAHADGGDSLNSAFFDALPIPVYAYLFKVHGGDDLLEDNLMPHLLHHLQQNCEEVSRQILISCCGYRNFNFHHIYKEIFDLDFQFVDHAAQSLEKLKCNQLSSVNMWSNVSKIITIHQHIYIHTQDLSIKGTTIDPYEHISPRSSCCTRSYLMDGTILEDTVLLLFGLCHWRWTITPPLLILKFNRGDILRLSFGEGCSTSTALRSPTSSAYAKKTIGRVTRGALTGMEHKGGPRRLQLQQVQARVVA
jgi:hypothetical protein